MKLLWLASMKWPRALEAICVGSNKNTTMKQALTILRIEHGTGEVTREGAMCSAKIVGNDIDMVKIPYFDK
jgi:hypothetical protein